MNIKDRVALIKEVGEEIVTEKELVELLNSGQELIAYDGFEPSGQMHIAQGIVRTININKMIKAGVKFKMLIADWHAMANKKMGGDLEKIQTVGKYFVEVWKATGMNLDKVEFVWASELVKNPDYWQLVLKVAATNSYKRFIRTAEIMGRQEDENITGAQIIYSCMQTADIFTLGANITQLGLDQRKVNVLAREIGPQLGFWKPVIVSHHMLLGLGKPNQNNELRSMNNGKSHNSEFIIHNSTVQRAIARKMSKSNPDSAIFMTDSTDDLKRKINKAYCPEGEVEGNPIMEYCRYILFESFSALRIERPEKFGGNIDIRSYKELIELYSDKKIHPMDLKNTVVKYLDDLLIPVRKHFTENPYARELLAKVQSFQVTR